LRRAKTGELGFRALLRSEGCEIALQFIETRVWVSELKNRGLRFRALLTEGGINNQSELLRP
jgi:hypothetical protein